MPLPLRSDISWKRAFAAPLFPYSEFIDRLSWTTKWNRTIRQAECPTFGHPKELYRYLHTEILKQSPIDYLEFGVAKGTTMGVWSGMNQNPRSRFFGFDAFLGLPEDWSKDAPKGTYTCNGVPPEITDPRINFQIGWFQDSLPGFMASYQPANRIVIHNDSDLYSSTLYTLTTLDRIISPETIVILDEFYDVLHEYRALIDYSTAYRKTFKIIAATSGFIVAAIVFSDRSESMKEKPTNGA